MGIDWRILLTVSAAATTTLAWVNGYKWFMYSRRGDDAILKKEAVSSSIQFALFAIVAIASWIWAAVAWQ